ncbi:acyltransferase family protein [Micromonospora sp. SH-82]|uniref:acyltransferase family protein n=1 Tax=Micromonospora sp. SH-82 TaxID=3132938 RepID=UPI003EBB47CB
MTSVSATGATATGATPALSRLPSLTGLRWIAALLVYGFHAATMRVVAEPGPQGVLEKVFTLGLSGVQFFFILSGFVLVWSARPEDSKRAFWRRRAAKIYPNHILMWMVVLLVGLYFVDPVNGQVALTNLLLLQAWDPTPGHFYSINTVSWSLSCELFFYLCLPFALPAIRRARPWMLWAVVVAVPLLILALWPTQLLVPPEYRWWFTQIFPITRSFEFWMGVAAAELMRRGCWRGPRLTVASVVFVAVWVAAGELIRAELWAAVLSVAYILVITAAADADINGRRSPWRSRPMLWLGEVSFAFYLVHVFVMVTVLRLAGVYGVGLPGWWGPVAVVAFLLVNLVLAGLMHRYLETPMMRLLAPSRSGRTRRGSGPQSAGSDPRQVAPEPQPVAPEPQSVAPEPQPVVPGPRSAASAAEQPVGDAERR